MKVVVTGGAGFIGTHLCRELLRRPGVEVVVLDNLSTGRVANLSGLPVDLRIGSVLDYAAVSAACAGADSIVHLAGVGSPVSNSGRGRDADVFGTTIVLDAARETGAQVVIASHAAPRPVHPGPWCVFELPHVFGPFQSPRHPWAVIAAFISDALHGVPLTVYGDGEASRDFTFVGSVAEVLAEAAASRLTRAAPIRLAFDPPTTINEVLTILSELLGHGLEVDYLPPSADEVGDYPPEPSELPALFPKIRPVPLAHGLLRTLSWLERDLLAGEGREVPA